MSGLGARRAQGGHSQRLGAWDVHGRQIRGPGTAGRGLYSVRGTALAAAPGSWGSGCSIKANNAAVVPSLPSPEFGRAGEPPNRTIIAHICWLTCAADGNSVCWLQRAAALLMEGTVKSGPRERPELGSQRPRGETPQPRGGAGVPQPWPRSCFGGAHSDLAWTQPQGGHQERCGATGPGSRRGYGAGVLPGPCLWGGPTTSRLTPRTSHHPWVPWQPPEPPRPSRPCTTLSPGCPGSPLRPFSSAIPWSLWQIP